MKANDIKQLLKMSYSYNKKKPASYGDWMPDRELSGERAQVYYNAKTKKAIVVHKGTQSIQDWATDGMLALGYTNSTRIKHGKKIQKLAEQKYGKENIESSLGHSLGSKVNEIASKGTSQVVVNLNKPTVPFEYFQKGEKNPNQIDIRTSYDPVSALHFLDKKNGKEINIDSRSKSLLTEHSTDVLNRINDQEIYTGQGFCSFAKYDKPTLLQMLDDYKEYHDIKYSKKMSKKMLVEKCSQCFMCDDDDNLFKI